MAGRRTSIILPHAVYDEVRELAQSEQRSMAWEITRLLEDAIKTRKEREDAKSQAAVLS